MMERLRWVFIGSSGIRAGWRFAMFVAINAAILLAIVLAMRIAHIALPIPKHVVYPSAALGELVMLLVAIFAAYVMARIERRPFAVYGLPWRKAAFARTAGGFLAGFAMISLVLLGMYGFHGFRITGIATHGVDLFLAALLWTTGALLIGMDEEFTTRGYAQFTLATGMGFWPAAIVLSLVFGALHIHNSGETPAGIAQVVVFALFMCIVLYRSGNLWLPIGIHAGWDWGESFFYGVPDSGLMAWHPFLTSSFSGPAWLSGGDAGPEGSVLSLVVLLIAAFIAYRAPSASNHVRA
jgi:uncharacterized protein